MKLNVNAFGMAIGILGGVVLLCSTLLSIYAGQGNTIEMLKMLFWFGFSRSIAGAFVGLIWGFVYGYAGGALVAWLYNKFADKKTTAKA